MKTWTKPVAAAVEAGFEVTRYLPLRLMWPLAALARNNSAPTQSFYSLCLSKF